MWQVTIGQARIKSSVHTKRASKKASVPDLDLPHMHASQRRVFCTTYSITHETYLLRHHSEFPPNTEQIEKAVALFR